MDILGQNASFGYFWTRQKVREREWKILQMLFYGQPKKTKQCSLDNGGETEVGTETETNKQTKIIKQICKVIQFQKYQPKL